MKSFEPSNKLSTQLKRLHFEAMKDDPDKGYEIMDWAERARTLEQRVEELEDHELEFTQTIEGEGRLLEELRAQLREHEETISILYERIYNLNEKTREL
jgi:predicted  nucleic acid-binding Zn-ribbon protein